MLYSITEFKYSLLLLLLLLLLLYLTKSAEKSSLYLLENEGGTNSFHF